jgi:hypothetical protein
MSKRLESVSGSLYACREGRGGAGGVLHEGKQQGSPQQAASHLQSASNEPVTCKHMVHTTGELVRSILAMTVG